MNGDNNRLMELTQENLVSYILHCTKLKTQDLSKNLDKYIWPRLDFMKGRQDDKKDTFCLKKIMWKQNGKI